MATPHISAEKGDFAKTVLMPGDPLRAKFIAETFLTDAVEVNHTRGCSDLRSNSPEESEAQLKRFSPE